MKTIVFINRARHSGKTTCAINIGAGLVRLGARVLLVDLDHQGVLTRGMGIVDQELKYSVFDLFMEAAAPDDVLLVRGRTGIIPATHHLSRIEQVMIQQPHPLFIIREYMEKHSAALKKFDYVIFDTPSNLGLLTLNAVVASERAIVPVAVGPDALSGIENVTRCIETIRNTQSGDIRIFGAISTRYTASDTGHRDSLVGIGDYFGDALFERPIRTDRAVPDALLAGYNVFEHNADSQATSDYMSISEELVMRN
jgi:chromosome partitioning protein